MLLTWLKGLIAAIISSVASAITAAVIEPSSFNLEEGLPKLLSLMAVNAIVGAALYLKQSPVPEKIGTSGLNKIGIIFLIALIPLAGSVTGCGPGQTMTQQMMEQTDDPYYISLGSYGDALTAYVAAGDTWAPFQKYAEVKHPQVAKAVHTNMTKARAILNEWKKVGSVPVGDRDDFRAYIRSILIDAALMDEGSK